MPNRKTHVIVGVSTGCIVAEFRAKDEEPLPRLLETVSGGVGGYIGSILPDIIEPALSPRHREHFHSVLAGLLTFGGDSTLANKCITWCRSTAEYYRREQYKNTLTGIQKFFYALIEIVLRILAGMLTGLAYGYMSHLALDAFTPNSLPLV